MADFNLEDIATRPELIREIAGTTGLIALTLDERDALVAIARWAQDTPHHYDCAKFGDVRPCTCGRDEALAPFKEADRG